MKTSTMYSTITVILVTSIRLQCMLMHIVHVYMKLRIVLTRFVHKVKARLHTLWPPCTLACLKIDVSIRVLRQQQRLAVGVV